jgi:hypothetical protein
MKELISFIFRVIGGKIRNAYDKLFLVCSICLWTLVYSCCELKKLADSVHFPINLTYTEKYSSASGGAKTNCIQIAAAIGSGFFCRMLQEFQDASAFA